MSVIRWIVSVSCAGFHAGEQVGRFLDLTPELRPSANNNLFVFALPE